MRARRRGRRRRPARARARRRARAAGADRHGQPRRQPARPRRARSRRADDGGGGQARPLHGRGRRRALPRRRVRLRRPPAGHGRHARRRDLPPRAQQLERRGRAAPACCATRSRARRRRSRWSASRAARRLAAAVRAAPLGRVRRPAPPTPRRARRRRPARRSLDRRGDGARHGAARARRRYRASACSPSSPTSRAGSPASQERAGGFALCSHAALAREPRAGGRLRAPRRARPARASGRGRADAPWAAGTYTHLCWGPAELRFAEQIHESEHALRASLVPLYRALRDRGGAAGEELEALLRGDGPTGARSRRRPAWWPSSRSWGSSASTGTCRPSRSWTPGAPRSSDPRPTGPRRSDTRTAADG